MIKKLVWGVIFMTIATLLQSTLLSPLLINFYAVPDLALCILVYFAYVNGTMVGQLGGFISGLFIDILSPAPLGLNAFVRTLTGALAGIFKGTFFLDIIFLPMALCAAATIFKAIIIFLLHLVFRDSVPTYYFYELKIWVEMGLNTLLAPLLFGLLRLGSPLFMGQREKG